jgi:ABC-type bacteriocin/lantibiotic exporter with double-glycine peptidase domain
MTSIFEYLRLFFDLLSKAGMKQRHLTMVALCYLLITIFDLLGLGAIFFFVSQFLGVEHQSSSTEWSGIFLDNHLFLLFVIPIIWLVKFVVVLFANRAIIRFSQNVAASLRQKIVFSSLTADYPKNGTVRMAAWMDTLTRQLSHAASGIIEPTLRGMCDLFLLFLVCAYLLWLAPLTFLMLAAWLVVGVVFFDLAIRGLVRAKGYQYTVTSEELTREFNDLATGFNEFWALRSYKFFRQRIREKLTKIISNYVTVAVLSMAPRLFLEILLVSGIVLILFISEVFSHGREQTLLSISIIGVGAIRLIPLISSVNLGINQLRSGYRTLENLLNFDSQTSSLSECQIVDVSDSIRLEGIGKSFEDKMLFENLDAEILKGKCTVISGPSGCGKTTLAEIIAGLTAPSQGHVSVHYGRTQRQGQGKDASFKVGYVSQSPSAVDGSLFENITFRSDPGDIEGVDEELSTAIRLSIFTDVLEDLPNGLTTYIGHGHHKLSGGQLQRLAICRAIYHSDGIIILDEPTSALDEKTELRFLESLHELKKDRILVIVTHSNRVIAEADYHICFRKRGNVIASATDLPVGASLPPD